MVTRAFSAWFSFSKWHFVFQQSCLHIPWYFACETNYERDQDKQEEQGNKGREERWQGDRVKGDGVKGDNVNRCRSETKCVSAENV